MAAPLATEIKHRLAESLIDRVKEKTAVARFWRYNACAKHGVPVDNLDATTIAAVEQAQAIQPAAVAPTPAAVAPQASGMSGAVKGVLGTLAVLGGLGGAGTTGYLLSRDREPAPAVAPAQAQPDTQPKFRESPFQYIEDQGEHLP